MARVLVAGTAEMTKTDIAPYALEALSESRIREVLVVGRRGPAQAAYTNPELLALGYLPGVTVAVQSTMLNDGGRVLEPDSGRPMSGVYTDGWIKRGPSGVIGTDKACAAEAVGKLVDDFHSGRLQEIGQAAREAGGHRLDD